MGCRKYSLMKLQVSCFLLFLSTILPGQNSPLQLWYDTPAKQWEESLPLGNGRLGMMPDGGVMEESIVLNDITLWSGGPQDANNYEANKSLPQIRKLILQGKNDEAQKLVDEAFVCKGEGSGSGNGANVPFGCYQVLGDLHLEFSYNGAESTPPQYSDYKRSLSLEGAIAMSTYRVNGVTYTREYFTSFGDDIGIIKISADKPGQLNCRISLSRPEKATTIVQEDQLYMFGQLNNGTDGKGMQYAARVKASLEDGLLSADKNVLVVKNATSLILYISAATDYKNTSFENTIKEIMGEAVQKPYALQKKQHIAAYQQFFNRVDFDLGKKSLDNVPTDKRLNLFGINPENDNGLAALFFQFGRYLSISSTRVGLLPPNLQGLWAHQIQTPWNGDYHLDVNIQMNHWPLEVTNLSELNLPLAELVRGMVKNGEKTAKAYYNADGWIAHVITNIWGYTAPGESASWGASNAGSGWLCNNLWQHYEFTLDTAYLASIYPILKGSAEFYNSALIKDPQTGWLVTSPSVSPENSFYLPNGKTASISMGPTIDNQIVRELFANVISASEKLGKDKGFRGQLRDKINQLAPVGNIAGDGRLMEWLEDYKEVDPHHRHISHLYGLYPASFITPTATPELAEASRKTLEARGDDGPSWSIASKLLFWARLQDGDRAYKLLTDILRPTLKTNINYGAGGGVYPNLLSAGPPFQIDGNFGATAGIAGMLIQSHEGFIALLPAIPDQWKASGEVKGLKARGNFTVDMKWKNGKVVKYTIFSPEPQPVKVKVNGVIKEVRSEKIKQV